MSYQFGLEDEDSPYGFITQNFADPFDPSAIASPVPAPSLTAEGANPVADLLPGPNYTDPYANPADPGNRYTVARNTLDSLITSSNDKKSKLQTQLDEPEEFSWSRALGQALIQFVPALAGKAIGGYELGAAGAQAGGAGLALFNKSQEASRLEDRTDTRDELKDERLYNRSLTTQRATLGAREAQDEAVTARQKELQTQRIDAGQYVRSSGGANQPASQAQIDMAATAVEKATGGMTKIDRNAPYLNGQLDSIVDSVRQINASSAVANGAMNAETSRARFEDKLAGRVRYSIKPKDGFVLNDNDVRQGSQIASNYEDLNSSLTQYAEALGSGMDLVGGNRATLDALSTKVQGGVRTLLDTGASLTGREQAMIQALSPLGFGSNGIIETIQGNIYRGDQRAFLDDLQSIFRKSAEAKLKGFNAELRTEGGGGMGTAAPAQTPSEGWNLSPKTLSIQRGNYQSEEEYKNALRARIAELRATNGATPK